MTDDDTDGDVAVCEGTVDGKTTAERKFEGIELAEVFRFDDDEIVSHRVYLGYSGIYNEFPVRCSQFLPVNVIKLSTASDDLF